MNCKINNILGDKLNINNRLHERYTFKKHLDKGFTSAKLYIVSYKNKKYILKIGKKNLIYPEIYFYCLFKQQTNVPKIIDYGKCNSKNPFENKNEENKDEFYYMVIDYIEGYTLSEIPSKKINIKKFKNIFKNLIKSYSKLNKKFNFKWGDLHLENLMYDKDSQKIMMIDLASGIDNKYKRIGKSRFIKIHMKYILQLSKKELSDLTKIVKLYNRKTSSLKGNSKSLIKTYEKLNNMNKSLVRDLSFVKIDYTTVIPTFIKYLDVDRTSEYYKNLSEYDKQLHKINIYSSNWYMYDIFSIFKIINLFERRLSNGKQQILLTNKDIGYLNNKKISFNTKLDYITNMKYFKGPRTVKN